MAVESIRPFSPPPYSIGSKNAGALPSQPRIPTGVPDFDFLTGGFPVGSLVLLFGEAGSGHQEFALTSAVHLMLHYDNPDLHRFYLGAAKGPFVYPESVAYVSLSRSKEQVLGELEGSFAGLYPQILERHLEFRDLSPSYFQDTVVPSSWASLSGTLLGGETAGTRPDGPLRAVAEAVDALGPRRLVLVDSLTDLFVREGIGPGDVLTLLKGLRRRAKAWGGLVYLLLSQGVAAPAIEQAVFDSTDGVLQFRWVASPNSSHRQRSMVISKFMPLLARLPAEFLGRFLIRVHSSNGLVTTQYERV
jgi:KaiC/GvpD/RAD55 family RecA-like ATPase